MYFYTLDSVVKAAFFHDLERTINSVKHLFKGGGISKGVLEFFLYLSRNHVFYENFRLVRYGNSYLINQRKVAYIAQRLLSPDNGKSFYDRWCHRTCGYLFGQNCAVITQV